MGSRREKILLVANTPEIIKTISEDTLKPIGFQVEIVSNAASALEATSRQSPDLVITDINLSDLSGKDLMVALNSSGYDLPIIVLSKDTMEGDILQAFRLGASDFICWPAKQAEIVAIVERVLKQIRGGRQYIAVDNKVKQLNVELKRRGDEFAAFINLCNAMTTISDQSKLLARILATAIHITAADCGWIVLRSDENDQYYLHAGQNLPATWMKAKDNPWEDELCSFVGISGETLSIYGQPLKQYRISKLGNSALLIPVKSKDRVTGILTVMRKLEKPFGESDQTLLQAISGFISISTANAHLLHELDVRTSVTHQLHPEQVTAATLKKDDLDQELEESINASIDPILTLIIEENQKLTEKQTRLLQTAQKELQKVLSILERKKP
jgi:DNA-binding response OmpR family regulator